MIKIVVILTSFVVILSACATHYIPATHLMIEPPPVMSEIKCFKITIVDPQTNKEVIYYAILEGDNIKRITNEKMKDEYMNRCNTLIGENKPK